MLPAGIYDVTIATNQYIQDIQHSNARNEVIYEKLLCSIVLPVRCKTLLEVFSIPSPFGRSINHSHQTLISYR